MTVTEFTFLALGLALGLASGVAFIEIVRARPVRRDVRVTLSQDAIPRRRATTLAEDAFVTVSAEPARGGPADRREMDNPAEPAVASHRTNVLTDAARRASALSDPMPWPDRLVGVPISAGSDPMVRAWQASGSSERDPATGTASAPSAVGLLDRPTGDGPAPVPSYTGPCSEERRFADERCELATRAQSQADTAAEALRHAQRMYDDHAAAAGDAADASNPKTLRDLKESAQQAFRAASRAAGGPEAVEAAARAWLQEINRINREAATAVNGAERERAAAAAIGATLEQLALDADAARVGAEMADAACVAARSAVADCDEQAAPVGSPSARSAVPVSEASAVSEAPGSEALAIALDGDGAPRIFKLLRGDRDAIEPLVASLAGNDPDERRRWRLAFTSLVEAIVADAIEESSLRFPADHVFWGPYTLEQNRDITRALASLGHRFDGEGGWVDNEIPTQRELSLALSFAGLDRMRVRQWPNDEQIVELFRNVDVAADEYLAGVAGDLTLAEMVEMLGRRADGLVELWNQWGRIRPLLLEDA